jgi:hypothetical protein
MKKFNSLLISSVLFVIIVFVFSSWERISNPCGTADFDPSGQPHIMRGGPNLLENSNFANTGGWGLEYGATYDSALSHSNDGSGSIKLPNSEGGPDNPTNSQVVSAQDKFIPVIEGGVYTLAGYMNTTSTNHPFVYLVLFTYDANRVARSSVGFSRQSVTLANEWQEIVGTYRPKAGDAFVRLRVMRYLGEDNLTSEVWVDDLYFGTGIGFAEAPAVKQAFDGAKSRIDPFGNIEINRNGVWEPYFPLCIYQKSDASQADLNAYSNQGFNCTMWGWLEGFTEDFFNRRQNATSVFNPHGMMALGDFSQYTSPADPVHYNNTDQLVTTVNTMMGNPSFGDTYLGYYLDNEQYDEYQVIKNITDNIKQLDSNGQNGRNHFIYMLQGNVGLTRIFDDLVDSVGAYTDSFPTSIGSDNLINVSNIQRQNKPLSIVVNSNQKDASANGLRSQLYLALIVGGKGLAVFKDPMFGTDTPIDQTDAWGAIPSLRKEIDQLMPIIRQPHWTNWSVAASAKTLVQAGTRNYNGEGYILLVNPTSTEQTAEYKIDNLSYQATSIINYFTDNKITEVDNNQFSVKLPAFGTAVFKLGQSVDVGNNGNGDDNNGGSDTVNNGNSDNGTSDNTTPPSTSASPSTSPSTSKSSTAKPSTTIKPTSKTTKKPVITVTPSIPAPSAYAVNTAPTTPVYTSPSATTTSALPIKSALPTQKVSSTCKLPVGANNKIVIPAIALFPLATTIASYFYKF